MGATIGTSLQAQGLNSLADWIQEHNFPAITGLVVRGDSPIPGEGFFKFYGKHETEDITWWLEEIRKAKSFNWSIHLDSDANSMPAKNSLTSRPTSPELTLRDIAYKDSRLFLKSEYGALSKGWPVVAFTPTALRNKLQRDYRTATDFIVYTGTSGKQTRDEGARGRLLSIVKIDTTRSYRTSEVIPKDSWEWASREYPGQWEHAFKATKGWDITDRPLTGDVIPISYSKMGLYPYRGMVLEVQGAERDALLDLKLTVLNDIGTSPMGSTIDIAAIVQPVNRILNEEAHRLADLVFSRVALSGQVVQKTAPIRSAPTDLMLQIATLLTESPLTCGLCGGLMTLRPNNKLLQPSGDRRDSNLGDYGPLNYQLVHLACNLGKNSASEAEFQEWLDVVRRGHLDV